MRIPVLSSTKHSSHKTQRQIHVQYKFIYVVISIVCALQDMQVALKIFLSISCSLFNCYFNYTIESIVCVFVVKFVNVLDYKLYLKVVRRDIFLMYCKK